MSGFRGQASHIQHPLVTLAGQAPTITDEPLFWDDPKPYPQRVRTPAEARRWARNRRKHMRGGL